MVKDVILDLLTRAAHYVLKAPRTPAYIRVLLVKRLTASLRRM
jgi:hypothetical protein